MGRWLEPDSETNRSDSEKGVLKLKSGIKIVAESELRKQDRCGILAPPIPTHTP